MTANSINLVAAIAMIAFATFRIRDFFRNRTARSWAVFCIGDALYLLAIYNVGLAESGPDRVAAIRLVLGGALPLFGGLLYFCFASADQLGTGRGWRSIVARAVFWANLVVFTTMSALSMLTDLIVSGGLRADGGPVLGPYANFFYGGASLGILCSLGVLLLAWAPWTPRPAPRTYASLARFQYCVSCLTLSFVMIGGAITNLVLPFGFENSSLSHYGPPVLSLIFSGVMATALFGAKRIKACMKGIQLFEAVETASGERPEWSDFGPAFWQAGKIVDAITDGCREPSGSGVTILLPGRGGVVLPVRIGASDPHAADYLTADVRRTIHKLANENASLRMAFDQAQHTQSSVGSVAQALVEEVPEVQDIVFEALGLIRTLASEGRTPAEVLARLQKGR